MLAISMAHRKRPINPTRETDGARDEDLQAFIQIREILSKSQMNTYVPKIGSREDTQALRLVQRGFLKIGPQGGYMIARFY